jgi:hypothetical protein
MEKMRDEFPNEIKNILAKRVGMRCSNPNCRKQTSGPCNNPDKAMNIGVDAHITGASEGGHRYDKTMTASQRKSIDNGIRLCQNCAKLIDNDENSYTVDKLHSWKNLSEEAARIEVEEIRTEIKELDNDLNLLRFFSQCFDRDAFKWFFHTMEEFLGIHYY